MNLERAVSILVQIVENQTITIAGRDLNLVTEALQVSKRYCQNMSEEVVTELEEVSA